MFLKALDFYLFHFLSVPFKAKRLRRKEECGEREETKYNENFDKEEDMTD